MAAPKDGSLAAAPGGGGGVPTEKDASLVAPDKDECAVCMDSYEAPVVTPCNHWFCRCGGVSCCAVLCG